MKIFIDKGYHMLRYLMLPAVSMVLLSCEDDPVTYSESAAIDQIVVDPYLRIVTPVVGFQAGTEKYGFTYEVVNAEKEVTEIHVYSVFTDAGSGLQSNEVLLTSIPVEDGVLTEQTDTVTYAELSAGLLVDGEALPTAEVDLKVGSGWKFRFEADLAAGGTIKLPGAINVAVLSPYAGIYKYTYMEYWRIGVRRDDVTDPIVGTELFIGSVDEDTFSHNDWWGPFAWTGCSFNFDINLDDNTITVPILTACGLFSGLTPLSCPDFASLTVPCSASNVLIPDNVTYKHVLKMSYGYLSANGPREFYNEYERVVD